MFSPYCDIYANGDIYDRPIALNPALNSNAFSIDCSDPIELDLSETSSSNTYTGTFTFFQDTFCNHDHLYDIWFTFVATRENMLASVSGEIFDFSLFKGSCENLELIECKSNVSTIKFENLIEGDRYLFRLSRDYFEEFELEIIPDYFIPEYQITNFNIPELSDTTFTHLSFREDIDGAIWLFAKNVLGHDVFMKYSSVGWEHVSGPCTACFKDVVISKDGVIYMAAGNDGLYQYENNTWVQILTEEVGSVFIDAFDQLAVINDVGVGKVIDNQFVETNNDGFPGFQPKTEVITPENRIYLDKYEYCYEKGWTQIYVPPLPTLCCQFGYTGIRKDTNYVLHYASVTHTLSYSYASIRAFDNGNYQSVDLIYNSSDFYDFVIDNDNAFWTMSPDTLRKDNGSFVREWPITELFSASVGSGTNVYSLFADSKSNCWIINRYSGEIVVLHPEDSELGVGFVADDFQAVELDCTTFTYDIDGDSYRTPEDCDDYNYWINPGVNEMLNNGKDDDCNPLTSDDDLDGDGYGAAEDCDDEDPNINPDQIEEPYNGIDDDCDLLTLDDDLDQDGFLLADDCDDNNADINPGQTEITYNGINDDCDPLTLDDDLDQDGFLLIDDCDDTNPVINPNAEEIANNGIDEDCNGEDLVSSTYELANVAVSIFPNPAIDIINLEVLGELLFQVNLFDINGKIILSIENSNQIKVSALQHGTYLLEIKDLKTGQKIVEKIIVGN